MQAREDRINARWGGLMALEANINRPKGHAALTAADFYRPHNRIIEIPAMNREQAVGLREKMRAWVTSQGGAIVGKNGGS